MIPRWVQIPVGLFLGFITLLCLFGSITLIIWPGEAPIMRPVFGIVMVLASSWLMLKCAYLVFGRTINGGLFGPSALRVLAWFFLLIPIGGIFSGWFLTHTLLALFQTATYISIFFTLRELAHARDKRKPAASD